MEEILKPFKNASSISKITTNKLIKSSTVCELNNT